MAISQETREGDGQDKSASRPWTHPVLPLPGSPAAPSLRRAGVILWVQLLTPHRHLLAGQPSLAP